MFPFHEVADEKFVVRNTKKGRKSKKKVRNTPVSVKKIMCRYNVENSWWEGAYIHVHKKKQWEGSPLPQHKPQTKPQNAKFCGTTQERG